MAQPDKGGANAGLGYNMSIYFMLGVIALVGTGVTRSLLRLAKQVDSLQ